MRLIWLYFRCNEQKIESTKKFLSKLWNVSRFLSSFPVIKEGKPTTVDKWILSELNQLVKDCKKGYDEYNFFVPAIAIREFGICLAHYMVEMVKNEPTERDFLKKNEMQQSTHTRHSLQF